MMSPPATQSNFSKTNWLSLKPITRTQGMTSFTSLCPRPFGWETCKVRCRNGLLSLEKLDSPESRPEILFIPLRCRLPSLEWFAGIESD